jgi:hypothetical protein
VDWRRGAPPATATPWVAGRRKPARGVSGRVEAKANPLKAESGFGSPTVADAGGPARPLPTRGAASSVRGEETVAAGLERSGAGLERPGSANALSIDGTVFKGKEAGFLRQRLNRQSCEPLTHGRLVLPFLDAHCRHRSMLAFGLSAKSSCFRTPLRSPDWSSVGGRARGGLPAACGRPAGRSMGTQAWLWRACTKRLASWVGEEAGLERREDRPPRANRPNGVSRPGGRPARNGDAVSCRTSGRTRKGRDGPRRGCGVRLNGRACVCGASCRRRGRPGATLAPPRQSVGRPRRGNRRRRGVRSDGRRRGPTREEPRSGDRC